MKCILLCSFLLLANAFNSKRSFQFKFPGDLSSYAELVGTINHELTDFTLCHWSKTNQPIAGTAWEGAFNYYLPSRRTSISTVFKHNKIVHVYANDHLTQTELTLKNNEWIHLCFIWSITDNTFETYINGQQVSHRMVPDSTLNPVQPNGIVLLGLHRREHHPLKGHMSEVNLWDYALRPSEVSKVYNCEDQFEGNIIKWSDSIWKLYNRTTVSQVRLPCHERE